LRSQHNARENVADTAKCRQSNEKKMSSKATSEKAKRATRGEQKKQSIFASGRNALKRVRGREETAAAISDVRLSQTVRPKAAIISHADWLEAMRRAERKEIERNKDLPNASFYLRANSQLGELFRRATKGDIDAARTLLRCLRYNVGELEKFCSSKLGIAKQMVVIGESWPLLHTSLKPNKDGALSIPLDHFLRKLGVVRGKRRYNIGTIGTAIAATLYKQMEYYRHTQRQTLRDKREVDLDAAIDRVRHLKSLSPSNYPVWWEAAEPLFVWQWGKEFQDHRAFKEWPDAAYKKLAPRVARNEKRRDIKRAVKQGFMSLANSVRDRVPD
jgi:hypothetical protein